MGSLIKLIVFCTLTFKWFPIEEVPKYLQTMLKSVYSMRMCLTVSGHWQLVC